MLKLLFDAFFFFFFQMTFLALYLGSLKNLELLDLDVVMLLSNHI